MTNSKEQPKTDENPFRVKLPGKVRSGPLLGGQSVSAYSLTFTPGMIVDGKYRLLRELARGGMGIVWLVEHIMLRRELCLKTLVRTRMSEQVYERFSKEIAAASRLEHEHLVRVFDCGRLPDKTPYYTMEYIQGKSLRQIVEKQGTLPLKDSLELFYQVASALNFAHNNDIVHRDIKPDNIVCTYENNHYKAKVLDFGLAKFTSSDPIGHDVTSGGELIGSPPYMSPEQCMGKEVDHRSDIYSLGCTFYEVLTGSPPFYHDNPLALLQMHFTKEPHSLRQASGGEFFPEAIETLIRRMLAKAPENRCRSMEEVMRLIRHHDKQEFKRERDRHSNSQNSLEPAKTTAALNNSNDVNATMELVGEKSLQKQTLQLMMLLFGVLLLVGIATAGSIYFLMPDLFNVKTEEKSSPMQIYAKVLSDPVAGDHSERRFHFPTSFKSGTFFINNAKTGKDAIGDIVIPNGVPVVFEPSPEFCKTPEVFGRFQAHDLTGLRFPRECAANDATLRYIKGLTGLISLDIEGSEVTNEGIMAIKDLPNLVVLNCGDTAVKGDAVAKIKNLPNFAALTFDCRDQGSRVQDFLPVLKNSQKIEYLCLRNGELKDEDIKIIGTMSNLRELLISYNSNLTEKCLPDVIKLHRLINFRSSGNPLSLKAALLFAQLPNLRELHITPYNWTDEDMDTLAKKLPKCSIQYK